jgi:hypothetical protein
MHHGKRVVFPTQHCFQTHIHVFGEWNLKAKINLLISNVLHGVCGVTCCISKKTAVRTKNAPWKACHISNPTLLPRLMFMSLENGTWK